MPRLNQSMVDRALPGPKPVFLWDSNLKGFGLRISRSGAKSYVVQYRPGGGRKAPVRRMTIARADVIPVARARKLAQETLAQVALGSDPAADTSAQRAAERFDAFAEQYLERHALPKKKPRSVEEDRRNLRLHLIPEFGSQRVADISNEAVAKFHARRAAAPVNANRCLSLLSHMMTLAEQWGVRSANSNPCKAVSRYRERTVERYLSVEEFRALGDALTEAKRRGENGTALDIICLLALTGARKGEIEQLKWRELDLARACARLGDSKTGQKTVHLSSMAVELISRQPRRFDSDYVFPATKGSGHFQGVPAIWRRVRAIAGLEDVRLHDLRHGFASVAAVQGAPLTHIGKALGHKELRTTSRYAHLSHDPVQLVIERASSAIGAELLRS